MPHRVAGRCFARPARGVFAAALLAALALPSHALFKVVGPDGSVTYTDRPPAAAVGKPGTVARNSGTTEPSALSSLPLGLRQVAQRYPVALYTANDCAPCDGARRLLQARGVPYTERTVTTEEDAEALDRLTGGRAVPSVTIGSQALRGFAESDWQSYLDAAGYPRESQLPPNYQRPAAAPLVQRKPEVAAATPPPAPAPEPVAPTPSTPPSPTGIRF
ncbi:MAG: glutaredoxin family protein [Nitrospira sp.]|nr:glutaredoxin family protein [Nitrospira sp.]